MKKLQASKHRDCSAPGTANALGLQQVPRCLTDFLPRSSLLRSPPLRAILLVCCAISPTSASFGSSYQLTPDPSPGRTQRVQVVLEVRGELRRNDDGRKLISVPLEVDAKLQYQERLLSTSAEPWRRRSLRFYEHAFASIKAGKGLVNQQLIPGRETIVAAAERGKSLLYCPLEPLSREELDLIDVQANSLLVEQLLPPHAVELGDSWPIDPMQIALLLGLDVATQSTVEGRLISVEDDVAVFELAGRVDGAAGGVASEIELKAKANFDLEKSCLTWFAMSLRERRDIAHAEPGFEVTARLRMAVLPCPIPPELDDASLARLPENDQPAADLLSYCPEKGGYQVIHDRRWRSMLERHDLTVLRFVDQGDLIAQCNISLLPENEASRPLTLENFQAEIQRSLGTEFGQAIEAAEATREDGRHILRVTVAGSASEIPIQWIYYHISDGKRRRAAIAFTLESKLAERFGDADRTLAESFAFTELPPQPQQEQSQEGQPQEARREDSERPRS